jgi:hypothetical protein
MPSTLRPGVLYVSYKYKTAAHLCACGCGKKVRTQLGPRGIGWQVKCTAAGPTLWPSIGNWQKDCRSHYYIQNGRVIWSGDWTEEEVEAGRREEMRLRDHHFTQSTPSLWRRLLSWLFR